MKIKHRPNPDDKNSPPERSEGLFCINQESY